MSVPAAGRLNKRITIESKGTGRDAAGQPNEAWTVFAPLWANIRFQNGKEYIAADSEKSIVKASMRIRYRTDITADMRVVFNGQIFDIDAVLPSEKDYLDLAVTVGGSKG